MAFGALNGRNGKSPANGDCPADNHHQKQILSNHCISFFSCRVLNGWFDEYAMNVMNEMELNCNDNDQQVSKKYLCEVSLATDKILSTNDATILEYS